MQATSTQFWLNILYDLPYDIDDILDEMVTEALVSQLITCYIVYVASRVVFDSPRSHSIGRRAPNRMALGFGNRF